jgi:hypothetical protein
MRMWKYILPLLLLFFLINQGEGYQNNTPPADRPDEIRFKVCHDYSSNDNLGNNNYKLHKHHIGNPLQGTYSSFLDTYDIRNYDEFFHAPLCESEYNFANIQSLDNRLIPDSIDKSVDDIYDIYDIYEEEVNLDKVHTRDPNFVYVNPEYIGNKLLYPRHINKIFLKNHKSHDTENLQHRLDSSLYDNY